MKKINKKRNGAEAQYSPCNAGKIMRDYLENSNEVFPVAYRKHKVEAEVASDQLFKNVYPDTHLCVDLKLLTRKPGHVPVGTCLSGVLKRDGERHFTLLENNSKGMRSSILRNPHLFRGTYVNVKKRSSGTLYLTFNNPYSKRGFSFRDYCQKVVEEVLLIANLFDK